MAILAFFTLIILSGCGYKDDPFYIDSNGSVYKHEFKKDKNKF